MPLYSFCRTPRFRCISAIEPRSSAVTVLSNPTIPLYSSRLPVTVSDSTIPLYRVDDNPGVPLYRGDSSRGAAKLWEERPRSAAVSWLFDSGVLLSYNVSRLPGSLHEG